MPGTGLAPHGAAGLRFAPPRRAPPTGMNPLPRIYSVAWIVVLVFAGAFIAQTALRHVARAEQSSNLAGGDALAADPNSPTGYAGGVRKLVLPELNHTAQQWIVQTQETLAHGEWRLRHLDTDNAPLGRTTFAPSPFRWWLGRFAQLDHEVSDRTLGQSVERVALLSGPVLLLLLLVSATLYVARHFGGSSATLIAAALALLFSFSGNFLTPLPTDRALALFLAVWALLPLLARIAGSQGARTAFAALLAALAGAALLWIDAGFGVVLLGGITLGGFAAAWLSRTRHDPQAAHAKESSGSTAAIAPPPWRRWSRIGALATLLAWVGEYAPEHLIHWRLDCVHPLHALAWLGVGELLHRAYAHGLRLAPVRGFGAWSAIAVAATAVLALPVTAAAIGGFGLLGHASRTARLVLLPDSPDAASLGEWLAQAPTPAVAAMLLPLALLAFAGWHIVRGASDPRGRAATTIALGVAVTALFVACFRVGYGALVSVAWLALLALLSPAWVRRGALSSALWSLGVAGVLLPGLVLLRVDAPGPAAPEVSVTQFDALLQRDLAHWIAARAPEGGAIVLAPPATTSVLTYFGGMRGLGTLDPENQEGFGAAVRICGTSSTDEAEALARKRGITHFVLPSWDNFMEQYARLGNNQPENTLVALLRRWLPPRWLRPAAYAVPDAGAEVTRQVAVFEVTEVQDQVTALTRLADYFIALGQLTPATEIAHVLEQNFGHETDALVARAQVAAARSDGAAYGRVMRELGPILTRGDDADLPWDRRIALAITLAQTRQAELARPRIERALTELDAERLRQLTPATLYRLHVLAKAFGQQIPDAELRAQARARLPAEVRGQF